MKAKSTKLQSYYSILSQEDFLTTYEVMHITNLSRTALCRLCKRDEFPHPVTRGRTKKSRVLGDFWHKKEVMDWLAKGIES